MLPLTSRHHHPGPGVTGPVNINIWDCLNQEEADNWQTDVDEPFQADPWSEPPVNQDNAETAEALTASNLTPDTSVKANASPMSKPEEPPAKSKRATKRQTEDLLIETVNATCWTSLQARTKCSFADVIMAQEHQCLKDVIAEKSAQLKSQGLRSF